MLVCPNCRSENTEEARFCQRCGRSLEPDTATLRSPVAREQEEDHFDVKPPKAPSAAPGIIALVLVVLALAGFGAWWMLRPNPCQGKYSSALFAYCAEIPQGWSGGSQLAAEGNLDRFAPAGADAVTWVRVREILPATTTDQYAQQFRTNQEADGLEPGRLEGVELDGEQAVAWDVSVTTDAGDPLRFREVVLVREDGGWRITLLAEGGTYQQARLAFEEMLQSWVWT